MDTTLEKLAGKCAENNRTVSTYMDLQGKSLADFVRMQADKVVSNRRIKPLRDPSDFYRLTEEHVRKTTGDEAADSIAAAMKCGVIDTADHHGGLFHAQTFQGDLLFGEILKCLGYEGSYVPVHAGGQVELGNITYARGVCTYTARDQITFLPIFPYRDRHRMTSHTGPVTEELLSSFIERNSKQTENAVSSGAVTGLVRDMWTEDIIRRFDRYSDQITPAGIRMCRSIFSGDDYPAVTYVELEEAATPLIQSELMEPGSIIRTLVTDRRARELMQEIKTYDGIPVSGLLFRNADHQGRKKHLALTPDGRLTATGWNNEMIDHPADPETICRLMEERRIIPGLFTMALLLAFERGISWMGGTFQTVYLPDWQKCITEILSLTGHEEQAELFSKYDCSGYVCGPMYAMYQGDGYACAAGPAEFRMAMPEWQHVREMMLDTDIRDSHIIGIQQLYDDLVSGPDKIPEWYSVAAGALYNRYPGNIVSGLIGE